MVDKESQLLDRKILSFIEIYREAPASDSEFEALAFEIFDYQFRRNSYYRKFCLLEKKTPENVRSWKEIPAMPTLTFKELTLASFPVKKRVCVFRTSGTTQEIKGAHFFDTLRLYEHSLLPTFKKYLLPDHAKLSYYFVVSSWKDKPRSSLSYMIEIVNRHLALRHGKYYIKKGVAQLDRLVLDLKKEKNAVILLATSLALKGFLDFLKGKNIKLHLAAGSRLMETGGYKGRTNEISKKVLYKLCDTYLGIPKTHCVSEYGMTELASQTYDTTLFDFVNHQERKPVKAGPAWLRTLVIDPRTGKESKKGQIGLLRHLDLANRPSVMAVQTEDLGRATGDGFELLGRAKSSPLRGCSLSYEELIKKRL